jgi:hypothetical protein
MRSDRKGSEFTVAPFVGAAGAAVAIAIATERAAGKRQTVALGGAAIAFAFSQATSGATRAFFQGAAIAGIGVAIAEWVGLLRQGAAPSSNAVPGPQRSKTDATVPAPEPAKTDATAPPPGMSSSAENASSPAPAAELQTPARNLASPLHAFAPAASPSPEAIEHLSQVNALLSENERRTLSSLNATASSAEVTALRNELLRRRPADAVAFLRAILRAAHAKVSPDAARATLVRS